MSGPDELSGRHVAVVGLGKGRTAVALVRFLLRHGARVTVTDAKGPAQLEEGRARLAGLDVALALGEGAEAAAIEEADLVFRIPGVRADAPPLRRAAERGVPVRSEMELFFRLCPAPIVGITGTKGKTTTATLVAAMLEAAGRHVLLGGNVGNAVLDEVDRLGPDDLVVLELSSFQLEPLRRSPQVAVVTLTGEDHLDVHDTRAAYHAAKRNLLAWQGPQDVAVLNLDDPATVALHEGSASEVRGFSLALRPRAGRSTRRARARRRRSAGPLRGASLPRAAQRRERARGRGQAEPAACSPRPSRRSSASPAWRTGRRRSGPTASCG